MTQERSHTYQIVNEVLNAVTHGIGAALTLFFVSRPLLSKLERLQTKYGMLEE